MGQIIISGKGGVSETFTERSSVNGKDIYHSEHYTDVLQRQLVLTSKKPTQNTGTYGVRRSEVSLQSHEIVGKPNGDTERLFHSVKVTGSFPAAGTFTEFSELCRGMSGLLNDPEFVEALFKHGQTELAGDFTVNLPA